MEYYLKKQEKQKSKLKKQFESYLQWGKLMIQISLEKEFEIDNQCFDAV